MKSPLYISVHPSLADSFWITRIIDGITSYAAERRLKTKAILPEDVERGMLVMLLDTDENKLIEQTLKIEARGATPLLVNAVIPDALFDRHAVVFSLDRAMHDCIDYLAAMGKERPALVGTGNASTSDLLKSRIFRHATSGMIFGADESGLSGAVDSFIAAFPTSKCDSVICANDTAAILLISRMNAMGIKVGHALPVIGMGNSHIGRHMTPTLTTVDFDYFMLGYEAAKLYGYLSKQSMNAASVCTCTLPTTLLARDSTGAVPYHKTSLSSPASRISKSVYTGEETVRLIQLEDYLQSCDKIDSELIFRAKDTYRDLAEALFASERTLKYRMSRILSQLGFSSKEELSVFMKRFL